MLFELLAEGKIIRIAKLDGKRFQRKPGAQEQGFCAVYADTNGILPNGKPDGGLKLLAQRFVPQIHLRGKLLSGDASGIALDKAAGDADTVLVCRGTEAPGGDGAQKLLCFKIQMQKLLFVGRLHFRKELLGGRQEFFKSGFVAAHDRTIGQKPHGQKIVIAFCTDADEKFKPSAVRIDDGRMLCTGETLDKGAAGEPDAVVVFVGIFAFPIQKEQSAVMFKSNIEVISALVGFV